MRKIFAGKKALVIGGTGGIGRDITVSLASHGADLVVIGSSNEHANQLRTELTRSDTVFQCHVIKLDADNAVNAVLSCCAAPDIVVCAYGPFQRKPLAETTQDDWRRLVTMNLILPGSLVSAYLGGMIERRWGRILLFGGTNTASIRGWTTTAPYAAAKTALGTLAKSVAKNAAVFGVSCNVICPGLTDTIYLDDAARNYNRKHSPTGTPLHSQDVAAFALEILKNPHINGAVLSIDQGIELSAVI
ncbi:MAG: SDR family NAD(P)-dependent oxidoreductase [Spirochaetaceae bacterium]|jgi:NAD(P)-dependent dehydrogenase (short-subunit alcohol dehydrogenase family)|nr:SDR family NAD(P)-dependent oxidoreductase [Spirochaetaceae bacterium]